MKIDIDTNEQTILSNALEQAVASAQRQQNMKGKTPQMLEVFKQHEHTLRAIQTKVNSAK